MTICPPQDLAKAVEDDRLRNQLTEELSAKEASAFDEYVSDYQARELIVDKVG